MLERVGRIALPPWMSWAAVGLVVAFLAVLAAVTKPPEYKDINVAFIGNSMMYYNDMPRFLEKLSKGHLKQNSCLHGNSDLTTILIWGSGMYNVWRYGPARISNNDDATIYDFGACTVPQLLFGYDEDLESRYEEIADDDAAAPDSSYRSYTDDYFTYWDGSNPCLVDPYYLSYLDNLYADRGSPQWNFVVMNDNTRSPARSDTRLESLAVLEEVYVPWFIETGATPVFLFTYGYNSPYRDMGGLEDVPGFTSLTYEGYKQYAQLLEQNLPESQKPRIAPVGLAFLIVWEENYSLWERLFHVDKVHASPLGTYLQSCVLHYTLFDFMPRQDVALRGDLSALWTDTRRFQPGEHRRTPFPTQQEAAYLLNVATRATRYGHLPKSLTIYSNGEASDYIPNDDLYKVDDLF